MITEQDFQIKGYFPFMHPVHITFNKYTTALVTSLMHVNETIYRLNIFQRYDFYEFNWPFIDMHR